MLKDCFALVEADYTDLLKFKVSFIKCFTDFILTVSI